ERGGGLLQLLEVAGQRLGGTAHARGGVADVGRAVGGGARGLIGRAGVGGGLRGALPHLRGGGGALPHLRGGAGELAQLLAEGGLRAGVLAAGGEVVHVLAVGADPLLGGGGALGGGAGGLRRALHVRVERGDVVLDRRGAVL